MNSIQEFNRLQKFKTFLTDSERKTFNGDLAKAFLEIPDLVEKIEVCELERTEGIPHLYIYVKFNLTIGSNFHAENYTFEFSGFFDEAMTLEIWKENKMKKELSLTKDAKVAMLDHLFC
jgi:hypothetical protein